MDTADAYKKILENKISGYDSRDVDNFSAPGELTVTITLNEYRYLVTEKAKADNLEQEWRTKWSKEYKRANELETENDMLTKKIMRMDNSYPNEEKEDE